MEKEYETIYIHSGTLDKVHDKGVPEEFLLWHSW